MRKKQTMDQAEQLARYQDQLMHALGLLANDVDEDSIKTADSICDASSPSFFFLPHLRFQYCATALEKLSALGGGHTEGFRRCTGAVVSLRKLLQAFGERLASRRGKDKKEQAQLPAAAKEQPLMSAARPSSMRSPSVS